MPHPERVRSNRNANPALLLLAVLGLLTMPVDYRAGAAISHPHAILQLVDEMVRGSRDHHGDPVDSLGHARDDHFHGHRLPPASIAPVAPASDSDNDAPWPPTQDVLSAMLRLQDGALDGTSLEDRPSLSPRSGGGAVYVAYIVLLPATAIWLSLWRVCRPAWGSVSAWTGLTVTPEPPPPRRVWGLQP